MVHLDYRDARPIYTQICDGIRDQILSGILRPDDRLPSVRELATQLTINPNTIQRAYRELEIQGWVASVPGKGCFVWRSRQCPGRGADSALPVRQNRCPALNARHHSPGAYGPAFPRR